LARGGDGRTTAGLADIAHGDLAASSRGCDDPRLGGISQRPHFLNVQQIKPRGNLNLSYFIDAQLARKLERVARLSGEARYRAYAALSVELARDAAPWVAEATGTSRDFFSARIGCQTFQPVYGMDLGALCIRREGG
jgi:hypothetical protein